ncbi:MAG: AI-2E family transporter [Planctomycetaceae bacterium]|jgi:predicted PurR-regulated permease PerM|nr:AI-2E family transporter [Planctomycetaceae bacterium]
MNGNISNGIGVRFLITAASLVVILAGLKAAQSLVAPFLLAVFFAMVLLPPLRLLQQKGFSNLSALFTLSSVVFLFGFGIVWVLSYSLTDFANRLPTYRAKATAGITQIDNWINDTIQKLKVIEESIPKLSVTKNPFGENTEQNISVTENPSTQNGQIETEPIGTTELSGTAIETNPQYERFSLFNIVHLDMLVGFVRFGVRELLNIVTVSFLIAVMVIFMLIEAARMPDKLQAAFVGRDLSNEYFRKIAVETWNYMRIKTIINLLTGFATFIGLWFIGVEYALLWGILMFFLNYIPNIGQFVASIPPVLLTLIDSGVGMAFVVVIWLVIVNTAFGYGIEPRYLESGLGISGLVVLLSLIFWGWLLGPIGMFLSAPLTMVVKIVLQNDKKTRWLAILISNHTTN